MTRGKLAQVSLYRRLLEAADISIFRRAISRCGGNVPCMSQWLGVSRAWIYEKVYALGLERDLISARKGDKNAASRNTN